MTFNFDKDGYAGLNDYMRQFPVPKIDGNTVLYKSLIYQGSVVVHNNHRYFCSIEDGLLDIEAVWTSDQGDHMSALDFMKVITRYGGIHKVL